MRLAVEVRRKVYHRTQTVALEGLRFHADPGEFVAIVGPSGAGKTTLLNIVGGLDRELDGDVELNHTRRNPAPLHPPRLGFIFQTPRLMPWLSVLDNVCLVLDKEDACRALARQLLQEVGLGDYQDAFPQQLSGGMQRRVALVRAFAIRPALLLMDEPFVSLDAPTVAYLHQQLLALWAELKPTVLYVTHDLREALALADRVLFLSGRPAHVVLDQRVDLPRPRAQEGHGVQRLYAWLLSEHPGLLSGFTNTRRDAHIGAAEGRRRCLHPSTP